MLILNLTREEGVRAALQSISRLFVVVVSYDWSTRVPVVVARANTNRMDLKVMERCYLGVRKDKTISTSPRDNGERKKDEKSGVPTFRSFQCYRVGHLSDVLPSLRMPLVESCDACQYS